MAGLVVDVIVFFLQNNLKKKLQVELYRCMSVMLTLIGAAKL
jgi:hypothetical protein